MLHIIPTIDYEIFGNGNGDVNKHIINPANKMLEICDLLDIKLTIMFEVYEYLCFKKFDKELKVDLNYSPATLIKNQITKAYSSGHDIELHIHPQFKDMDYINGKFSIYNYKLSVLNMDTESCYDLIKKGLDTLNEVINRPNYKCVALRLSNMPWIQPPKNTIDAMKRLGLTFHSLDVIHTPPKQGFWELENSGIYELPINTMPVQLPYFLTIQRMITTLYIWLYSPPKILLEKNGEYLKNGGLFSKFDLSKLTTNQMLQHVEYSIAKFDFEHYEVPLIIIGHTKDFLNYRHFENFLRIVKKKYIITDSNIKFSTIQEFYSEVKLQS